MQSSKDVLEPGKVRSRRTLLKGLAGAASLGAAINETKADEPAGDVDPSTLIVKLIRRVTYGINDYELSHASRIGYDAYLEYHLNPQWMDDAACDARLAPLVSLRTPAPAIFGLNVGQTDIEMQEGAILRAIFSRRQLYERMVEFWSDHFNIDYRRSWCNFLKPVDDRTVIRPNAMGNFGAMLRASARSAAMLEYLDNTYSTASAPNENYARELMELHTLGTDSGFTQADVQAVARCFTGWCYTPVSTAAGAGVFRFDPSKHDDGPKTIFAGTPQQLYISPGGWQTDGDRVLTALINHPSTASFIARKIARWLLQENPTNAMVNAVAAAYTSTGGDIRAMVRAALQPALLAAAAPKFKRPYHYMVSVMRAVPINISTAYNIRMALAAAGQAVCERTTPDGYPDSAAFWIPNMLPRWNFGMQVANWGTGGAAMDVFGFFGNHQSPPDVLAERIDEGIFGGELPAQERLALQNFYQWSGLLDVIQMGEMVGLAFASPSFQWY